MARPASQARARAGSATRPEFLDLDASASEIARDLNCSLSATDLLKDGLVGKARLSIRLPLGGAFAHSLDHSGEVKVAGVWDWSCPPVTPLEKFELERDLRRRNDLVESVPDASIIGIEEIRPGGRAADRGLDAVAGVTLHQEGRRVWMPFSLELGEGQYGGSALPSGAVLGMRTEARRAYITIRREGKLPRNEALPALRWIARVLANRTGTRVPPAAKGSRALLRCIAQLAAKPSRHGRKEPLTRTMSEVSKAHAIKLLLEHAKTHNLAGPSPSPKTIRRHLERALVEPRTA